MQARRHPGLRRASLPIQAEVIVLPTAVLGRRIKHGFVDPKAVPLSSVLIALAVLVTAVELEALLLDAKLSVPDLRRGTVSRSQRWCPFSKRRLRLPQERSSVRSHVGQAVRSNTSRAGTRPDSTSSKQAFTSSSWRVW